MRIRVSLMFLVAFSTLIYSCGQNPAPSDPVATFTPITGAHKIEVRGKRLYLDGEPFYVRGVGYEAGCRPNRLPWKRDFEPDLLRWDFTQIRQAGFNAIRTWSPMTDSELVLAAEHGLWVIQGVWTDWTRYWTDSSYHGVAHDQLRNEVLRASRHPNILYFLVMNEPSAELLLKLDPESVRRGFSELRDVVHKANPAALASFSNCPLTDFIETDVFDIVSSNNYPYGPETILSAMGYDGYTDWIIRRAGPVPYLTTEFGLPVSPEGPGKWGYGGNTLEEQADGVTTLCRIIASSGAAGSCPFMWVDGWWKSPAGGTDNEKKHDPHPEEWFGFFDVSPENLRGTARPVVGALAELNRLLVLEPAPGNVVTDKIRVSVISLLGEPRARANGGEWIALARSGHDEWSGDVSIVASGGATVEVEAGGVTRSIPVSIGTQPGPPARITLTPDSAIITEGEFVHVTGRLEDFTGASVNSRSIFICLRDYRTGGDRIRSTITDSQGIFHIRVGTMGVHGVLGVAVGAECGPSARAGVKRRAGDLAFIRILPNKNPGSLTAGHRPSPIAAFEFSTDSKAREAFQELYTGDADVTASIARGALLLKYRPKSGGSWIYIASALPKPLDISDAAFLSYDLSSTKEGTTVRVMLKDEDGERWFQSVADAPGAKSKTVVWDLRSDMMRDPYDGVKNGNGKFDPERVAGISVVLTNAVGSEIRFSRMNAWK